jgi:hypothetical protein
VARNESASRRLAPRSSSTRGSVWPSSWASADPEAASRFASAAAAASSSAVRSFNRPSVAQVEAARAGRLEEGYFLRREDPRLRLDRRRGTLPPSRRASDNPIAMACFRLFTVLPDPPDLSWPRFISCMARSTFFWAFWPYFLSAISNPFLVSMEPPGPITMARMQNSGHAA